MQTELISDSDQGTEFGKTPPENWQSRFPSCVKAASFPESVDLFHPEADLEYVTWKIDYLTSSQSRFFRGDPELPGLLLNDILHAARIDRPAEAKSLFTQKAMEVIVNFDDLPREMYPVQIDRPAIYQFLIDTYTDPVISAEMADKAQMIMSAELERLSIQGQQIDQMLAEEDRATQSDEHTMDLVWNVLSDSYRHITRLTEALAVLQPHIQKQLSPIVELDVVERMTDSVNILARSLTGIIDPTPIGDLFLDEDVSPTESDRDETRESIPLTNYAPALLEIYSNPFVTDETKQGMQRVMRKVTDQVLEEITVPLLPRPTRETLIERNQGPIGVLLSETEIDERTAEEQADWDSMQRDHFQYISMYFAHRDVLDTFEPGISAHIESALHHYRAS